MAGVLPYLGTSVSTIYCAWEITHAHNTGSGFLMSEQTAEAALHVLEPLQVGYGAVVSYALQLLFLISLLTPFCRSSPSSALFTGVWSSLVTVDTKATSVMLSVSGPPQSHGPLSSSRLNTL